MFPYVLFKWMPFKARLEGKEMDAKRDMGGGGGGGGGVWSTGTTFFLPYYAEIPVIYEKRQFFFVCFCFLSE